MRLLNTSIALAVALSAGIGLARSPHDGFERVQDGYSSSHEAQTMSADQRAKLSAEFGAWLRAHKALPAEPQLCHADGEECERCETIERSGELLVKYLAKQADSWEVITPLVRTAFLDEQASEHERDALVQLLGWTGSKQAAELGEALFKARPQAFSENQILALAEGGSDVLLDELRKLSKKNGASVRPAALLAMRANKYAKKLAAKQAPAGANDSKLAPEPIDTAQLERDIKSSKTVLVKASKVRAISRENALDALLAAVCLEQLGEEGLLREVQSKLHESVISALDAGRIDEARELCLLAEFAQKSSRAGYMQLGFMDQRCKAHCRERAKEIKSADQVFALIERVTPV
jgi:hypothetical protein